MRLSYNSPVILNLAILSTTILILQEFTPLNLDAYTTLFPVFDWTNPVWYLRLFSYVLGHGNWEHLILNFSLILLVGPILEEKYGSGRLTLMILVTALVTSLLHLLLSLVLPGPPAALKGASGIAFMMIVLASFGNSRTRAIPLTFLLVVALYLGREIWNSFAEDNISQLSHIIGGVMGAVFGFAINPNAEKPVKTTPKSDIPEMPDISNLPGPHNPPKSKP